MANEQRDSNAQERLQGTGNEIKGRAEQAWGSVTGDRAKQGEGVVDEAKGKLQQGIADVKDAITPSSDDRP